MFLEAALALQKTSLEQKILSEAKKSIHDADYKFVEAEQKEDKYVRELFEKLLRETEKDSWKH